MISAYKEIGNTCRKQRRDKIATILGITDLTTYANLHMKRYMYAVFMHKVVFLRKLFFKSSLDGDA